MDRIEIDIARIELDPFVLRDRARALRSDFLLGLARRLTAELRVRVAHARRVAALLGA